MNPVQLDQEEREKHLETLFKILGIKKEKPPIIDRTVHQIYLDLILKLRATS